MLVFDNVWILESASHRTLLNRPSTNTPHQDGLLYGGYFENPRHQDVQNAQNLAIVLKCCKVHQSADHDQDDDNDDDNNKDDENDDIGWLAECVAGLLAAWLPGCLANDGDDHDQDDDNDDDNDNDDENDDANDNDDDDNDDDNDDYV